MAIQTLTLGDRAFHFILDGFQHLDGGAMFGVVPKALWSKKTNCDELNRVPLACWSMYFEWDGRRVLVETGIGEGYPEKFRSIYGLPQKAFLLEGLKSLGVSPHEITDVIQTHLHFDHAGWLTRSVSGKPETYESTFPRARIWIHEKNFQESRDPEARNRASYLERHVVPVATQFHLVQDNEAELFPGVTLLLSGGHCQGHCGVRITHRGETLLHGGDIFPTSLHLPVPWIMAYDIDNWTTLGVKKKWLKLATEADAWIVFEHDPALPFARIRTNEKGHAEAIPPDLN